VVHQCLLGKHPYVYDVYNKSFKVKSDLNVHQCMRSLEHLHMCVIL